MLPVENENLDYLRPWRPGGVCRNRTGDKDTKVLKFVTDKMHRLIEKAPNQLMYLSSIYSIRRGAATLYPSKKRLKYKKDGGMCRS